MVRCEYYRRKWMKVKEISMIDRENFLFFMSFLYNSFHLFHNLILMRKCIFFLIFFLQIWSIAALPEPSELVEWAESQGLTRYRTLEEFRYSAPISRQEASAIFVRTARQLFHKVSPLGTCPMFYLDEKDFDKTLKDEIYQACVLNIMRWANGSFMPHQSIAHDQALVVLIRALDGGMKDENRFPWYKAYADRATELWLTLPSAFLMKQPISRGKLLEWIYTLSANFPLGESPTLLSNTVWTLDRLNGNTVNNTYTLSFDAGNTLATEFCNMTAGKYTLQDGKFTDTHLFSTLMYCYGERSQVEGAFSLENARYTLSDSTLTIQTVNDDIFVWKRAPTQVIHPLVDTTWKLLSYNGTNVLNNYSLSFSGTDTINAHICNSIFWTYSVSGSILYTPWLASTEMYCPGERSQIENDFSLDGTSFVRDNDTLTLKTQSWTTFTWIRQ